MRRRGGYRENFSHRFGGTGDESRTRAVSSAPRVWLQAVSVGEMLAIAPLLEALHRDGAEIFLTTTTSTGYRLAKERYGKWAASIGYFPLDWQPFSVRAWRRIRPDVVILTEGERWPEHMRQARRRGVRVIAINARLSDRSFHRMRRFLPAARLMTRGLDLVLAASEDDAARFRELGVSPERVISTGNIKLDVHIPRLDESAREALRLELGLPAQGKLLLGSSTWPGEEASLIAAWRAARAAGEQCSLLLVPRHAERRDEIEKLLTQEGLRFHLRSRGRAGAEVDVALADTTGELRKFLQLADLVFVGKSLPPHTEGQTPVEAASLGCAVIFGPGMANFRVIARELLAMGGAVRLGNDTELEREVSVLLSDKSRREELGRRALAWHRANVGSVDRTLAILRTELQSAAQNRLQPTVEPTAGRFS